MTPLDATVNRWSVGVCFAQMARRRPSRRAALYFSQCAPLSVCPLLEN